MAYAAVTSLLNTLEKLKLYPRISMSPHQSLSIRFVWEELKYLQDILKRLDGRSKSSSRKKVNALDAEIKEAVWRFHDLFESRLYHHLLLQFDSDQILDLEVSLPDLRQDFYYFRDMIEDKQEEYLAMLENLDLLPEEEEEAAPSAAIQTAGGRGKFNMVGNSLDMLSELIGIRLDSSGPVDVVPIVGMAGIGKTAVAREFFDDPELGLDRRAWVSVGRKPPSIHTIKRDILTQLDPASKDRKIRERDVEHLLKRIFKANRCLLVLDDVWDTLIWDGMKSLFPDYGRGKNLVLLTTRLGYAGVKADESFTGLRCEVQLLDEDESWDLLRQRVLFEEGECPLQLIESGKNIAEKCDGLPLMIIAVAALLSEAEMTAEFWEEVAEKPNHPIFTAAYDQLYEVLLPSYEYLPQHLKPCFLHMGVFPQFAEIRRVKFLFLWLIEGFLDLTMDDCFHTYLREIIDHNVAIVCQSGSLYNDSGIKTCRLHSTFWYLCRREATDTKFCRVLITRDEALQQLSMKGQRRLSFHNSILFAMNDVMDSVHEACASSARSLLCYGSCYPYPVPIFSGLRLLKLLDVLFLRFYEFPEQVFQLVYLQYLALTCNTVLPPSISRLWDLRYLSIHRYEMIKFSGETPRVPVEIWNMKQLEYMVIQGWNLPNPPPRGGDNGASFSSLERLGTLGGVSAETCTKEVLERIPNLSKLWIQIETHPDGDDMEGVLDHLSNIYLLPKLLSLKCIVLNPVLVMGKGVIPPASMFPSSLTKLLLSGTGYSWEYMSIIGSLPNLQVLKLGSYAFRGPEWIVRYGKFRALTYLLIEGTDLVHFEVEDRGLFSLRNFHIGNCYKLKHVVWEPDLSYPIVIETFDCSPATAAFAGEMRSRYESHYQMQDVFRVSVQSSWE